MTILNIKTEAKKIVSDIQEKDCNYDDLMKKIEKLNKSTRANTWEKFTNIFFRLFDENISYIGRPEYSILNSFIQYSSSSPETVQNGINLIIEKMADSVKAKEPEKNFLTNYSTRLYYLLKNLPDENIKNQVVDKNIKDICFLVAQEGLVLERNLDGIFENLSDETQRVIIDYLLNNSELMTSNGNIYFINNIFKYFSEDIIKENSPKLIEIVENYSKSSDSDFIKNTLLSQINFYYNKEEEYQKLSKISIKDLLYRV